MKQVRNSFAIVRVIFCCACDPWRKFSATIARRDMPTLELSLATPGAMTMRKFSPFPDEQREFGVFAVA